VVFLLSYAERNFPCLLCLLCCVVFAMLLSVPPCVVFVCVILCVVLLFLCCIVVWCLLVVGVCWLVFVFASDCSSGFSSVLFFECFFVYVFLLL